MKKPAHLHSKKGIALFLVLAAIVILSILVVGFLAMTTTELASSKAYASGVQARSLSDLAVNLVIGQVQQATDRTDDAWISQPGLLRTYNSSGQPTGAFKLYSSNTMTVSGSFDPKAQLTTEVPTSWKTEPSRYVDLNQPVNREGKLIYPVLDPSFRQSGTNQPDRRIKGFDIKGPDVPAFNPSGSLSGTNNLAAMPVQWLYVLKSGSLVSPGTLSADGITIPGATKADPPVGRIAFWTDDDTSKININTAAGDEWATNSPDATSSGLDSVGSFWDTPTSFCGIDFNGLAIRQPIRNEFSRYPGHPATTYLSAVFPYLTRAQLLSIAPRTQLGGSQGGTLDTRTAAAAAPVDNDRLYASTDELVFSPELTGSFRTQNPPTPEEVAGASFFITAQSRAPETNLFNKPRVAIWPEAANPANRTRVDRLIAKATTVGGQAYYFTRANAQSATADAQPGSRNMEVYNYLKGFTGNPYPGFGAGTFEVKYSGTGCDQILTTIFDYIRSTNLVDTSAGATPFTAAPLTPGSGQVTPIQIGNTRGFGRVATLSEIAMMVSPSAATASGTTRLRALLLMEMFVPGQGFADYYPNLTIEASGLDNIAFTTGTSVIRPFASGTLRTNYTDNFPNGPGWHERRWGGWMGPFPLFLTTTGIKTLNPNLDNPSGNYPFVSNEFSVPLASGSYSMTGTFKVAIVAPGGHSQSFDLTFPPVNLTVPNAGSATAFETRLTQISQANDTNNQWRNLITFTSPTTDRVRSLEVKETSDLRLLALKSAVDMTDFKPTFSYTGAESLLHSLRTSLGYRYYASQWDWARGTLVANVTYYTPNAPDFSSSPNLHRDSVAVAPPAMVVAGVSRRADWDSGVGTTPDGPYINKPDEGNISDKNPYFSEKSAVASPSVFSPNRQIASPVMFGSLPAGNTPWRTLLFSPVSAAAMANNQPHPGAVSPPDHLLLDLFTMPVVEPYAISEPFSTAGKANLNHQIAPFTYIERTTHLQGLLRSVRISAVETAIAESYKFRDAVPSAGTRQSRWPVNITSTLDYVQLTRFDRNKPFLSASEVCEIPLVPQGITLSGTLTGPLRQWWNDRAITGDNLRERPYATLYPRLTTRSNTYTVHVRVQSLQKTPNTDTGRWAEGKDIISGEFRGAFTIERYLNPNMATHNDSDPLTDYRFRTVYAKEFNP